MLFSRQARLKLLKRGAIVARCRASIASRNSLLGTPFLMAMPLAHK